MYNVSVKTAYKSGIYIIRRIKAEDSELYVGSTINFRHRWECHRRKLCNGAHGNAHLQAAWNKYGAEAFRFEKLLICEKYDLHFYERQLIASLGHYNIATDPTAPMRGRKLSTEHKEKMRIAGTGRKHTPESIAKMRVVQAKADKVITPEHSAKLSLNRKGARLSPEHIEKIRLFNTGRRQTPGAIEKQRAAKLGKKLTPEHVENMRKAKLGKPVHTEESRRKLAIAWTGRRHTEESKAKMSSSTMGKPKSAAHKLSMSIANKGKPWTPARRAASRQHVNLSLPLDFSPRSDYFEYQALHPAQTALYLAFHLNLRPIHSRRPEFRCRRPLPARLLQICCGRLETVLAH
jgi:group I intron endonuclease